MQNVYGLDLKYVKKKLECVIQDIECYTPEELARELKRIANSQLTRKVWVPSFMHGETKKYLGGDYHELEEDCATKCEHLNKVTNYNWEPSLETVGVED